MGLATGRLLVGIVMSHGDYPEAEIANSDPLCNNPVTNREVQERPPSTFAGRPA
jgi:hypothetical protein